MAVAELGAHRSPDGQAPPQLERQEAHRLAAAPHHRNVHVGRGGGHRRGELGAQQRAGQAGVGLLQGSPRAGVRRIKFHGLRHTSATLALQNGVSIKVVQERLGHAKIATTMDIYAHALPTAQRDAAALMGKILHHS